MMLRQPFPNRIEHDLPYGNANQMGNQNGFVSYRISKSQSQVHVCQSLFGLARLEFGGGAHFQHYDATLNTRQMWKKNVGRVFAAVFDRES